jgi:geranylgeranylglycerol-phosphate geranylgeranyltransferase
MKSRRLGGLTMAGARFLGDALRGRATLGLSGGRFARAVLQSLRPHYFALPAGACLAGAAAMPAVEASWRVAVAATASGVGWGVGQLLNDLLDTEADAVDAPDRPAVRGLLPAGPTMVVAWLLGLFVAVLTVLVHTEAWLLAVAAVVLLLGYGEAKRWPGLGNAAHGALIATAAAIGAVAAAPSESLPAALRQAWPACALTGAWAAVYLQSNYEKDRTGDAHAGCRTLAHALGLRASAALRVIAALTIAAAASTIAVERAWPVLGPMLAAVGLVVVSAAYVLRRPDQQAALDGYRFAVHGGTTGMLAMAAPVLGSIPTVAAIVVSAALTERAFRRDSRMP